MVLTSSPYYNLEVYSQEETQCENRFSSYEEWKNEWLFPLIKNCGEVCRGPMCWNVANVGKCGFKMTCSNFVMKLGGMKIKYLKLVHPHVKPIKTN